MKTKKIITFALLAVFTLSAQAQIVSSRSAQVVEIPKEKTPRTFMWTARAGYSFDTMTGADDISGMTGFDGGFGFTHYLGENNESGLFWGLEAHGTSFNANYEFAGEKLFAIGVVGVPRIGYKIAIPNTKFAVAPYVGAYVGYIFEADEQGYIYETVGTETVTKKHNYYPYSTYTEQAYITRNGNTEIETGETVAVGLNFGVQFFLTKSFFIDMHIMKSLMDEDGKYEERSYVSVPSGVDYSKYAHYNYSREEKFSSFKFVLGVGFEF